MSLLLWSRLDVAFKSQDWDRALSLMAEAHSALELCVGYGHTDGFFRIGSQPMGEAPMLVRDAAARFNDALTDAQERTSRKSKRKNK